MRILVLSFLATVSFAAGGAERTFDFGALREKQILPGFRSAVTGLGKPGDWKVLLDDAPSGLPPVTPEAPLVSKQAVLAQLAQDSTDEHFPVLIYEDESFGDFTLTTRFKTVRGEKEQMAGIAFRIQDETNYYVVRASSLGNTFRFYKISKGERGPLVGPEIPVPAGVWHVLTVECKGNQIRCLLNGKELISVTDKINPYTAGKIGFWTKSDSVSYFSDTKMVYAPLEMPAQKLVKELVKKYPRLIGLKVYMAGKDGDLPRLVASKDQKEVGQSGAHAEQDVLHNGAIYHGKNKGTVSVTMPVRDRNGEPIAAVRVTMSSFPGQTEQNALARAMPIVKEMQARVQTVEDLLQ
jgi:hypothetical protein